MKKFISIIALSLIITPCYLGFSGILEAKEVNDINYPEADDFYLNKNDKKSTPKIYNPNPKLDAIAQRALKAAENRDQNALNKCAKEFMDAGVKEIFPLEVVAKKSPDSPDVEMELNGKKLSGSTCAKIGYVYKGKPYWAGHCKQ